MKEIRIGNTLVGDNHPCYIVAEIGINHNGDIEIAKKIIDVAVNAGCNAVKFQKRTVDVVYAAEELARKFLDKSGLSVQLVRDIFYQCADISHFDSAMQRATELGILSWKTEDGQEGLKAFLEKRKPVWKNK